jgi:xylulokinase
MSDLQIARSKPEVYAGTSRISLVSSWIPSLFIGQVAPIEVSDASGMNLMDVLTCKWDAKLVEACGGPDLRGKLGPEPVPGGESLRAVSAYWTKRWSFNGSCIVAPFTGDNPATVVALSTPGDAILSLGTSTTFLLSIPPADTPPARFTTSHLLSHPTTPGAQIAMLCYKNGALAREEIRNTHASSDWARFNDAVEGSPAGNGGQMGLYFPLPEIIPPGARGTWLFKLQPGGAPTRVDALAPPASHPRAILESQLLSIRARVAHILPADEPHLHRLVLTGGSSANHTIRQLAADLFGIPAYVAEGGKQGAGTGGAVLAKFAWWKTRGRTAGTFEEMVAGQNDRMKLVASPNAEVTKVYDGLVEEYEKCEAEVVKHCS